MGCDLGIAMVQAAVLGYFESFSDDILAVDM